MARERTLKVTILGDSSSAQRAIRGVSGQSTTLSGKMSTVASRLAVAARGIALVGGAIGGAALYGIKQASDLGESVNKANVIFEKNRQTIQAWAKTTAESMGIARAEALDAASGFGAMLNTAGVASNEIDNMSIRLVGLAADMASFNNQDPSEMLDKLRSGLAGEAEPLRRFGVFLSESAIQLKAVRMGLIKQGETMTEAQKVQARYNLILEQTQKQQGDFARTAGTSVPNQLRILRASFDDVASQLGQKLLPVALKVVKWANENLPEAMAFASRWFKRFQGFAENVVKVVQALVEGFLALKDAIDQALGPLDEFLGKTGGLIGAQVSRGMDVTRGLGDFVGSEGSGGPGPNLSGVKLPKNVGGNAGISTDPGRPQLRQTINFNLNGKRIQTETRRSELLLNGG